MALQDEGKIGTRREKTRCDDKGRDWSDAAVSQGTPGVDSTVTSYEEAGKVSPRVSG